MLYILYRTLPEQHWDTGYCFRFYTQPTTVLRIKLESISYLRNGALFK